MLTDIFRLFLDKLSLVFDLNIFVVTYRLLSAKNKIKYNFLSKLKCLKMFLCCCACVVYSHVICGLGENIG